MGILLYRSIHPKSFVARGMSELQRSLRRDACSKLALFLIIVGAAGLVCAAGNAAAAMLGFRTADFNILSANGSDIIGSVHYDVQHDASGAVTVTSAAHYANGQYDKEVDVFAKAGKAQGAPQMSSYEHDFFKGNGSLFLGTKVSFTTGEAVCTDARDGSPKVTTAKLDFPPDAYAGAALILPLQYAIAHGANGPIDLYGFSCASGPRLFKVQAYPRAAARWDHYPGELVRADIKPDFGWLGYLIAPFVPEMHAWFALSAAGNVSFVGAEFSRYYKGPEIIMQRVEKDETRRASTPPLATDGTVAKPRVLPDGARATAG